MQYKELKERQRATRDNFSTALSIRVHRALSWLQRAEMENYEDSKFIFLWISFNAAYAYEVHDRTSFSERRLFVDFLSKLIKHDDDQHLYTIVWNEFPKSIRLIMDNQYIFQPFWEYQKGVITEDVWKGRFQKSKRTASKALGKMNTKKVLSVVFDRLYVLRNQLVHGGSTWNSQVNRKQVKDGGDLMMKLVPSIIHIMMESHDTLWGDPSYPVIT